MGTKHPLVSPLPFHKDILSTSLKKRPLSLEHNERFIFFAAVLAELDGLSRDAAIEKYGDATHAVNVREGAATAMHFVQSNKSARLKCVTSQGSVAPANMFSLEMDTLKVGRRCRLFSCLESCCFRFTQGTFGLRNASLEKIWPKFLLRGE